MWEMLRNILLYDMSYNTVSPSNSLSYDMLYDSIKQRYLGLCVIMVKTYIHLPISGVSPQIINLQTIKIS